ncbi:MAG: UDP-N-acetylglucosamine 2-epimerase (non-hydrolyzing), partial [Patescibacteria group bacterium]
QKDWVTIHTGQHYSHEMDQIFFQELKLPKPTYQLKIGSGTQGKQTGKMLIEIEKILIKLSPDRVLVQGDTNSTLAGGLAAAKLGIPLGHIEAGLRSYDRTMPEEINRIIVDHLADWLFAPTAGAQDILLHEGIDSDKIFMTGNTAVDAVKANIELAKKKSQILTRLGLAPQQFLLATLHRSANVDEPTKLQEIIHGLEEAAETTQLPVIFPVHPRTRQQIKQLALTLSPAIRLVEPVGYFDCLILEKNARLIFTDSGGIQEEACILGTPCVTLRENTERPETVEVGANFLVGKELNRNGILTALHQILNYAPRAWKNPFGDGTTSTQILKIITKRISATNG